VERCSRESPALAEGEPGHLVACHVAREGLAGAPRRAEAR
jgi:hypothetical protein